MMYPLLETPAGMGGKGNDAAAAPSPGNFNVLTTAIVLSMISQGSRVMALILSNSQVQLGLSNR
ncbi:hypothetical protein SAMN05428988_4117 [Chitinophaga sp. YR573]|nr:hypothetical protein SAMN05428988_4117 [Chitinophaga sp. YR573]